MTAPGTVALKWAEFERTCMPGHAGTVQRLETRRGFYAGALSMLNLFVETLDDEHADIETALNRLHAEMARYCTDLQEGRA
jgi:hypothetical protein